MKFKISKYELIETSLIWIGLGVIGIILTIAFLPDAINYVFNPNKSNEFYEKITGESFLSFKIQVVLTSLLGLLLLFGFIYYIKFLFDYFKKKNNER